MGGSALFRRASVITAKKDGIHCHLLRPVRNGREALGDAEEYPRPASPAVLLAIRLSEHLYAQPANCDRQLYVDIACLRESWAKAEAEWQPAGTDRRADPPGVRSGRQGSYHLGDRHHGRLGKIVGAA